MTTGSQNEYVATTSKIAPSCWVASLPYVVAVMASFIAAGMSNELAERLGPLPRTHGLLAAMLTEPDPSDLRAHNPNVAGSNSATPISRTAGSGKRGTNTKPLPPSKTSFEFADQQAEPRPRYQEKSPVLRGFPFTEPAGITTFPGLLVRDPVVPAHLSKRPASFSTE